MTGPVRGHTKAMTAPWRLLASAAAGVAHYVFTLALGPNIHCEQTRGCPATEWIQAPSMDAFALPLSLARDWLASTFEGWTFATYSAVNSLAFAMLAWVGLWLCGWLQAKALGGRPRHAR